MSEVHRYRVVKMLSERGNELSYTPYGPLVILAEHYDALMLAAEQAPVAVVAAHVINDDGEASENTLAYLNTPGTSRVLPLGTKLYANSAAAASKGDPVGSFDKHMEYMQRCVMLERKLTEARGLLRACHDALSDGFETPSTFEAPGSLSDKKLASEIDAWLTAVD